VILCLDLGLTIGWTAGALDGHPTVGATVSTGTDMGWRMGQAANTVRDLLEMFRPDFVWKEAPVVTHGGTNAHVLKLHFGWHAIVEEVCWRADVSCGEVDVDDVRAALMGRTRLRKEDKAAGVTMKHLVEVALAHCGYAELARNHNSADALALWLYIRNKGRPRVRR
jgi:hypothetical protein